MMFNELQKTIH